MTVATPELPVKQARDLMAWARDFPADFMSELMGSDLTDFQLRIVESVRTHRHTAVKTCHSPGKTYSAGRLVLWALFTHPPSKVITTAPSNRQVYGLLWGEVRTAHATSKKLKPPNGLGGECLKRRLELAPGWFAEGFSTKEYSTEQFQGYHAPYILVVLDEASGVPDPIFDASESLMASGDAHLLLIGNPTRAEGRFREAFDNPLYDKISCSAFETPNFTTFGITRKDIADNTWEAKINGQPLPRPYLITPQWVAERARAWGMDSMLFRVKVDAEFPEVGQTDKVIPLYLLQLAQNTEYPEDAEHAPFELGVDVARYGTDESAIVVRAGRAAIKERVVSQRSVMALVGAIREECEYLGWARVSKIKLDVIGLGAGPVDRLVELQEEGAIPGHVEIVGVSVAVSAANKKRYVSHRDELWWMFREMLQDGEIGGLGLSDEAIREFSEPTYEVNSKGQYKVEAKEELRPVRRLGRSPDRADAWLLAFGDCLGDKKRRFPVRARSSLVKEGSRGS